MKKYFMSGTDDEVKFGDVIDLDLTKTEDGKTHHKRIYCTFMPELVPLLLDEGAITEVDDDDIIDFSDDNGEEAQDEWDNSIAECLTDFIEINKQLVQKVTDLETEVKELRKIVSKAHNAKKTAA